MLFTPLDVGPLSLPNRIVMAPMTRMRADIDGTPTEHMATYYAQRASAGLIVTEGIWPTSDGQSEWRIPGLETPSHVAGWRRVTDRVHGVGGRIVAQLMHGGRNGHPDARYDGTLPAGPSAVPNPELIHLPDGSKTPQAMPRVLSIAEIHAAIEGYARAATNAIAAGFDAVEIHGANSYLVHQFLADNTNLRTDEYGDRIRFAVEVVDAVTDAIGADRTAIRLSPGNPQSGMIERDPAPVYRSLLDHLNRYGLAYLHLTDNDAYPALADLRSRWDGVLIANVGENRNPTTRHDAELVLRRGLANAVSFGRGFLVNPDLPARLAHDLPWNPLDVKHLYTPGPVGYTDYPTYEDQMPQALLANA